MDCFVGGLRLEIQLGVQELKPKSLKELIKLSRVEEAKLEAWLKRSKVVNKPVASPGMPSHGYTPHNKPVVHNTTDSVRSLPVRGLTRDQINEKRRKGLCFSCDEPYSREHICKRPHLFMIIPSVPAEVIEEECCIDKEIEDTLVTTGEEDSQITRHALLGHSTNNTIRLLGMANGKFIRVLVDSGSTNNLLDPQAAKRVKTALLNTNFVSVTVADGFKVESHQNYPNLQWTIQGDEFHTEFRILPLGGIDVVFGVQWLKLFDSVTFDFHNLHLTLSKAGKTILLQGESDKVSPSIQLMDSGEFHRVVNGATHGYFGYLFGMCQSNEGTTSHKNLNSDLSSEESRMLEELLQQFSEVFQEPKGVPPNQK